MSIPRIASYPMPVQWPDSRVQWPLQPHRAALLVHDMQSYFLDFYDVAQAPVPTLLAHVRQLVDQAHALGIPVFYSAQPHQQSAQQRGLLQSMWGPGLTSHPPEAAHIHPAVAPADGDVVLTKWRYSAFQRSDLAERLDALERDQLLVCGVYAHIGCLMSAAEAFMKDIQPFFVADALADWRVECLERLEAAKIELEWQHGGEDSGFAELGGPDEWKLSARQFAQTTRILREATNNIIKHSGARRAQVSWVVDQENLSFSIRDYGRGISEAEQERFMRSQGMISMKRRAKSIQGQCLVESGPGYGTLIRVTVPLRPDEPMA
jgi:isochorismate hydrolase